MGANNKGIITLLKPRARRALSREVRTEAPLDASSEAISTLLEVTALHSSAKLTSSGRAKALSAQELRPAKLTHKTKLL